MFVEGSVGTQSSCLSRIPGCRGSDASLNTNSTSLLTVEMIQQARLRFLLGFQQPTVCFGCYPGVQNKDTLTGTGES